MEARNIQGWLNGEKLRSSKVRKQYKLIGLILVLIFVYITAGYRAMEQQHRLSDLRKEVRDKKFEYLTISSQLVNETRQSRVAKQLEERGSKLKPNKEPAIRIQ